MLDLSNPKAPFDIALPYGLMVTVKPLTALSKQNSEYLRWPWSRLDRARKIVQNQWWQNLSRSCGQSIRFCFDNARGSLSLSVVGLESRILAFAGRRTHVVP